MQIELDTEVEAKLADEASRNGLTPVELSRKVLTEHASRWQPRKVRTPEEEEFLSSYIARMKEKSPGWETRDPFAVDWQAIKAEGRKY